MSIHVPVPSWSAFVDESQSYAALDPHTYILAAAVCADEDLEETRAVMGDLKINAPKVHWRDESDRRRDEIVKTICASPVQHLVVVRDGRQGEKPERRRRHCMEVLVSTLDELDVHSATFESRGPADDNRDRKMLDALRSKKQVRGRLRMEHVAGPRDPLLWIPDALCGAVSQHRVGVTRHLEMLQTEAVVQLVVIDVPV